MNMGHASRVHVWRLRIPLGVEVVVVMMKFHSLLLRCLVVRLDHLVKHAVVVLIRALCQFVLWLTALHRDLDGLASSGTDDSDALRPRECGWLGPKIGLV